MGLNAEGYDIEHVCQLGMLLESDSEYTVPRRFGAIVVYDNSELTNELVDDEGCQSYVTDIDSLVVICMARVESVLTSGMEYPAGFEDTLHDLDAIRELLGKSRCIKVRVLPKRR